MTERVRRYRQKRSVLVQRYSDMKCRTLGKPMRGKGKASEKQPWLGLELCDRGQFIQWGLDHPEYNRLFDEWEEAGFPRALSPSVHRGNSDKGYSLDNIEWVTHRTNSVIALAAAQKS